MMREWPIANVTDEGFQRALLGSEYKTIKRDYIRRRRNTQAVVDKLCRLGVPIHEDLVKINDILQAMDTGAKDDGIGNFESKNIYNL